MAMLPQLFSLNGLAVELNRSRRHVAKALREIPADGELAGKPAWFLSTALTALNGHPDGAEDSAAARARLAAEQADYWAMRNALQRGELLDAGEAERKWTDNLRQIRAVMLAVPGRVATRLSLSAQHIAAIDKIIREALEEAGHGTAG
jgi:phage terminase Nu1 subunit (DNA packaging protein)